MVLRSEMKMDSPTSKMMYSPSPSADAAGETPISEGTVEAGWAVALLLVSLTPNIDDTLPLPEPPNILGISLLPELLWVAADAAVRASGLSSRNAYVICR